MNIVVVEDNEALNLAAVLTLKKHGYTAKGFTSGEALIEALPADEVDLFILDIKLPKIGGFELMETLRPYFQTSDFIFISTYDDMIHISRAFQLGCEDYLKKPFDLQELLLRVEKIAKRRRMNGVVTLSETSRFDMGERQLRIGERIVDLTPKESKILELLVRRKGQVVPYSVIAERVWGTPVSHNTIASVIRRLRKKMQNDLITSVREEGYRLR